MEYRKIPAYFVCAVFKFTVIIAVALKFSNIEASHLYSRMSIVSISARLELYCKHSGMKVLKSPHDIRRTFATNLYYSGMPLKDIQGLLGHSTLQQTERYICYKENKESLEILESLPTVALLGSL